MAKTLLSFLFCFLIQHSFSQQFYIRGRVSDEETQQPLKGASVYINNTTRGTITNTNGEFELGPFSPGRYEVVASFVGFSSLLYSAEIAKSDRRVSFKLARKEETLREVLVLSDETRKRYLEIFKEYVIGKSVAAERCEIKNSGEIQFASGETKDEIIAYTDQALVIENPEFGYTLHFDLLNFSYNKKTGGSYFFGYTRFVDMSKDEGSKKKWLRRRKQCYEGSTVHFFRSLIDKELEANGFTVYQMIVPARDSLATNTSSGKMAVKAIEDSMISVYSDSIYRVYQLNIKDGWRIIYAKSTDLKNEIVNKLVLTGQPPKGTINGLRLRQSPVLVTERGINLTPINAYYDGIWAYERLANMLPEDYEDK
jgi:hypothetical protein